jgi:PUA-domain protein
MSPTELKIHQRHMLKSKDVKKLKTALNSAYPPEIIEQFMTSKSRIEWVKLDQNQEIYAIDGVLSLWVKDGKFIPLLSLLMKKEIGFKSVKVDVGAIKFVSKGADIMRPGIIYIDPSLKKGDIVLIKDPTHNRVLAVGEAKYNFEEMDKMEKGKVIKGIHSLSDPIWKFSKNFK